MQAVAIKWIDASYSTSTWKKDEAKDFSLVGLESIGWLVEERKDCFIIATENKPEDGSLRHLWSIPKSGIVEVKKLSKVNFRECT